MCCDLHLFVLGGIHDKVIDGHLGSAVGSVADNVQRPGVSVDGNRLSGVGVYDDISRDVIAARLDMRARFDLVIHGKGFWRIFVDTHGGKGAVLCVGLFCIKKHLRGGSDRRNVE